MSGARSWWKRYQGVTAFVGMPGSGKTYALAEIARRNLARGRPVWSNAGFEPAGTRVFETFDQVMSIENGVIVWDELPIYFNARRWQEFPDGMLYKFTQIRKDGVQLYYSAIHEDMIDATVRRLTFWYWHCRAITGRVLTRSLYPPQEFRKARSRPYRKENVWVRDAVISTYDTLAKVAAPTKVVGRIESTSAELWAKPQPAAIEAVVVDDAPIANEERPAS